MIKKQAILNALLRNDQTLSAKIAKWIAKPGLGGNTFSEIEDDVKDILRSTFGLDPNMPASSLSHSEYDRLESEVGEEYGLLFDWDRPADYL